MEIIIGCETIVVSDELVKNLVEISDFIINKIKELAENISNVYQALLEQSHQHCYCEDKTIHYYDKNKGCPCKKVTYKCNCGKKFYETYECYEPPPKDKNKSNVLQKNKKKYSNHS